MPDTRVICYMTTTCSGDFFITTGPSCCNNLEEPLGFSYQSADYMCEECPTGLSNSLPLQTRICRGGGGGGGLVGFVEPLEIQINLLNKHQRRNVEHGKD